MFLPYLDIELFLGLFLYGWYGNQVFLGLLHLCNQFQQPFLIERAAVLVCPCFQVSPGTGQSSKGSTRQQEES